VIYFLYYQKKITFIFFFPPENENALLIKQGVFILGDKMQFLVQFIERNLLALKFYFKAV